MYDVYIGDVEEDGQNPIIVRSLPAMWSAVFDAFTEWQTTYWTCWAVSLVRTRTSCHYDTTGSW